jgi:hypothetical protein
VLTQRSLADAPGARAVVDYALARRAVLGDLTAGRTTRRDICDAQPYLRRAARYHGSRAGVDCPVCQADLVEVSYVYGDGFKGDANGRARARREIEELADTASDFTVYVVEICLDCGWNHLVVSCVMGTGEVLPAGRRRSRA